MRNAALVAIAAGVIALGALTFALKRPHEAPPCAEGFVRIGARCCPGLGDSVAAECPKPAKCPKPLAPSASGDCDAPAHDVVVIPAVVVLLGPSDWEAEGRVKPTTIEVSEFAIDRFEVTVGHACAWPGLAGAPFCGERDPARAAYGVSLEQARGYCRSRDGALPSDAQWLAAAAGDKPRRYPWGDTGAVCRRVAFGLASGPCAEGGRGPDTVGAHPDGATPLGVHDLAGNVAEWVELGPDAGGLGGAALRGGSWKTELATELRTWLRREASAEAIRGGDPTIGFRCAYGGIR